MADKAAVGALLEFLKAEMKTIHRVFDREVKNLDGTDAEFGGETLSARVSLCGQVADSMADSQFMPTYEAALSDALASSDTLVRYLEEAREIRWELAHALWSGDVSDSMNKIGTWSGKANAAYAKIELLSRSLSASTQVGSPVEIEDAQPPLEPIKWLTGWSEILKAVGMKSSDREKVKRLNEQYEGPIPNPGQGGQPIVDRRLLIDWWNKLDLLQQAKANARDGKILSAEASHHYGRSGEVAPEVSGSVKRRRKPT